MTTPAHLTPTDEVKRELVAVRETRTSVRIAELATMLRLAGTLQLINGQIALEAELHTPEIVQRVRKSFFEIYSVHAQPKQLPQANAKSGAPGFLVRVLEGEALARRLGLIDARGRAIRGLPNRLTTGSIDELAGIWRGAFLARGTLTPPSRAASLEITCPSNEAAMALAGAGARLGITAKSREIRGQIKVVVRESESIGRALEVMGATGMFQDWNTQRKERESRAATVRLVNFDDANMRRSAHASAIACARVERALELLGAEVPPQLKQAGDLRLAHRNASLDELGAKAVPPLTKDAIAGRIRRLLSLADRTAKERGVKDTQESVPTDLRD